MTTPNAIAITISVTIGERLKAWRTARGLSQRGAAEEVGIKQPAWCSYENDEALPRADTIEKLVRLTMNDAEPFTLEMFAEAERARARSRSGVDESGPHAVVEADKTG